MLRKRKVRLAPDGYVIGVLSICRCDEERTSVRRRTTHDGLDLGFRTWYLNTPRPIAAVDAFTKIVSAEPYLRSFRGRCKVSCDSFCASDHLQFCNSGSRCAKENVSRFPHVSQNERPTIVDQAPVEQGWFSQGVRLTNLSHFCDVIREFTPLTGGKSHA